MGSSNKESKSSSSRPSHQHHHHKRDRTATSSSTAVPRGFSFLFVVNDLVLSDTPDSCSPDRWGNVLPPTRRSDYEGEITSPVFRWQDGRVTALPGDYYGWDRPNGWGTAGRIWGWTVDPATNMAVQQYMVPFDTYTVFRGWRFLPVVFMGSDATATNVDEAEAETMYHALSFSSEGGNHVSLAGPRGRLYAAGKDAGWVGRLVPDSYRNPYPDVQTCRGLAGSLPLILGLMGLSQTHGRAADAFTQGLWRDRNWHGPRWSFQGNSLTAGPDVPPRGVVVHVCCDEFDNATGSTIDMIRNFQTDGPIVR